jgi:hypothetical protein
VSGIESYGIKKKSFFLDENGTATFFGERMSVSSPLTVVAICRSKRQHEGTALSVGRFPRHINESPIGLSGGDPGIIVRTMP